MTRTLLRWHLGLGDALLCNGLVRELVDCGHTLILPCYPHNQGSVGAMFSDLGATVELRVVADDNYPKLGDECEIRIGYFGQDFNPQRWDESFYNQAGVQFRRKWDSFKLPSQTVTAKTVDRFIHDDPQRGFVIKLSGYRPEKTASVWDHLPALMGAKEIHCIDSCFAIMADLLDAPGAGFLHLYARPGSGAPPTYRKKWAMLFY